MTRTSLITLVAVIGLAVPTIAQAQTNAAGSAAANAATDAAAAVSGSTDNATAGAAGNATAGAGSNTGASTNGDSASVSTQTSITLDANADGTISADEIAAVDTALGTGTSIDVNGDGSISDEEAAAANTAIAALGGTGDTVACSDSGLEGMIGAMGMPDMDMLGAAANVKIVVVSDCEADDVTAALAGEGATGVRKALEANAAAVAAIQARGGTLADVVGATTSGDTVTVYLAMVAG